MIARFAASFRGGRVVWPFAIVAALAPAIRLLYVFTGADHSRIQADQWSPGVLRVLLLIALILGGRSFYLSRRTEAREVSELRAARENRAIGAGALFCIFLPLLFFNAVYSWLAYAGFYLGDADFTNISAALNATGRGRGFLDTPYVDTGPHATFLAHHFSPALLFFVPFYFAAAHIPASWFMPTHFLYAILLWAVLVWGLWLWTRIVQREAPAVFGPAVVCVFAVAAPIWRLGGSFHFEILVLPFAGLLFLARTRRSFWVAALLLLMVKEDMAVYLAAYALFLRRDALADEWKRREAVYLVLLCLVWFAFAVMIMVGLRGDEANAGGETGAGLPWGAYWLDLWNTERRIKPALMILMAMGLLPLLSGWLLVFALLPVLALHVLSYHPWHQGLVGHYVYAILPALLLGTVRGLAVLPRFAVDLSEIVGGAASRLRDGLFWLAMALACYTAAGDSGTPPVPPRPAADRPALAGLIERIPTGACVQAAFPASPHLSLDARALPLLPPATAVLRRAEAPYVDRDVLAKNCNGHYLLFTPELSAPPYYIEEHLRELEGQGSPVAATDDWVLRKM